MEPWKGAQGGARVAGVHRTVTAPYAAWFFVLLIIIYVSNFVDRLIVAIVGPSLKAEMHLTDLQLGLLSGLAFALFNTVMGFPFARLAERYHRVTLISLCTAAWSILSALSGAVHTFWQLLLLRFGVGVGEAGLAPAAHSLISDYFPRERRGTALAVFSLGAPLGSLVAGVAVGAIVGSLGWRAAYWIVGLPGLILALLMFLTIREPQRGLSDVTQGQGHDDEKVPPFSAVIARLWKNRSSRYVVLGCSLISLGNFSINTFIPLFFVRVHGLSVGMAGMLFGLITGISAFIGNGASGYVADRFGRRDFRWYGWVPSVGCLLASPFYVWTLLQGSWVVAVWMLLILGVLISCWYGPSFAVVHNLVPPRMRATASSILLFCLNILGQGVGPALMGFLSDRFTSIALANGVHTVAQASATGLRYAMVVCVLIGYVGGPLFYLLAARSMNREMARQSTN